MKRIRNAALLAALLALSGVSQARVSPAPRSMGQLEDLLAHPVQPNAHRQEDPDERGAARKLDYTQESRLNHKTRHERRHKARAGKEHTRKLT